MSTRLLCKDSWKKQKKEDEDVIEPFCAACIALPLAFVGVSASAYGASSRGSHKKQKKIQKWSLWGGIILAIISIIVTIYTFFIAKCVDCGYTD